MNIPGIFALFEMARNYGIDAQKIFQSLMNGVLNGETWLLEGQMLLIPKSYIVKDELYKNFIAENKTIDGCGIEQNA